MTQGGVIAIDSVENITEADISEADARDSGYASREELIAALSYRDDPIYRIRLHFGGEDPRIALREKADVSGDELAEIVAKLQKMDSASKTGPWTQSYLDVIDSMPATYSGLLADYLGIPQAEFKPKVRKLKALGLTESLEIGYRLSLRGKRILNEITEQLTLP